VHVCCVQADGGRLPACINAASLAFTDAGIAMADMVVSCSAGHVDGQVLSLTLKLRSLVLYKN
jgi:ribonuclease PH